MPKLPYANNGLEPVISQATIDYHYGKHLQTYVNNLNSLAPSTEFEGKTVEEIVASAPDGAIFNNAGQVLNHTLYFLQFTPKPSNGFRPARHGLLPFGSLVICSFPCLSIESQAQPEPNSSVEAALNSFLKFSKLPKSRLIASPSLPAGSFFDGFGANCRKYRL